MRPDTNQEVVILPEYSVLTTDQQAILKAALNRLIPAEGALPAAGDLGVAEKIEQAAKANVALRRTLLDGLATLANAAWRTGDAEFIDLLPSAQDEALRLVENEAPAFFRQLLVETYRGYYADPTVVRLVGGAPRPPQPEGFALPPFDPRLLDKVRARGPIYRPTRGP